MEHYNYHFDIGKLKQKTAKLKQRAYEQGIESAQELRYVVHCIDQLTTDVGRALLKAQALTDLLIECGVVDPIRLEQICQKVDELDGNADGVLDPAVFRTEDELERHIPTRVLLTQFEEQDQVESPEEFLSRLEHESEGQEEDSAHDESEEPG